MIRWGHGHSTLLGLLLGAVVFRGWGLVWAISLVFCLGLAIGRAWDYLRALLRRGLPELGRFTIRSDGSPYPGPGRDDPQDVTLRRL